MLRGNYCVRTFLFGCAVVVYSSAGWCEEEYRGPDYYQARHQTEDFIPEAQKYFEAHADYEIAPRVALDLYMAATLKQDLGLSEWAMARLVFDYPESLSTRFLLTTIPQPNTFGTFLSAQFNRVKEPDSKFIRKFAGAVDLGIQRFGPQLVAGDDLLISTSLASLEHRLFGLGMLCLKNSGEGNTEVRDIVNILLNERLSPSERYVRMQSFSDREVVRTCQRVLFEKLSPEEQGAAAVRRTTVESLLREMKFAEALPLLEQLAKENGGAQVDFWRGWSLASLGRDAEAREVLQKVVAGGAGNVWSKPAREILKSLSASEEILKAHAAILQKVVAKTRVDALETIELTASYAPPRGAPVEMYFWQDASRQEMEVLCRRGGQPVISYLSANEKNRVHFAGEPQIHQFDEPGGMVATRFSVDRRDDGDLRWNFNWQLVGRSLDGGAGLYRLFDSPFLQSEASLFELLKTIRSRGSFPLAVANENGMNVLRWIEPAVDRPDLKEYVAKIGADNRLVSLRLDRVVCDAIRHGPRGSFERKAPPWPKLQTALHARTDGAVMFRFMSAVMSFMGDPTDATAVAERVDSGGVNQD